MSGLQILADGFSLGFIGGIAAATLWLRFVSGWHP